MQPKDVAANTGAVIIFYAKAVGVPEIHYQWYKNAKAISGASNSYLTLSDLSQNDAATYSVSAINSSGKNESRKVKVTIK